MTNDILRNRLRYFLKFVAKEDQNNERFKEAQGRNGQGGGKIVLRTATVSGAGVLHFPDTPIMCFRVSDDIDAVIWVKTA